MEAGVPQFCFGGAADGEEAERERQQSGAQAGSSGRGGATPGGQQGGLADARTGAAAVPGREEPPQAAAAGARSGARPGSRPGAEAATLAAYFARRGSVVRMGDAFRIFCGILSLLKMLHARGVTLRRVRPSMLRITSSGVRHCSCENRPFSCQNYMHLRTCLVC